MSKKKYFLLCIIISLFILSITHAQNNIRLTKQQWLEDLDYVAKALIDKHPDIHHRINKYDFEKTVADAEKKIRNSHADEECLVAIRQVVASIQDGHTRLGTNSLPGYRDIFPVRMCDFSDGIFITGIAEKYAKLIGMKVIKIGQISAEEAFKRAGTIAFADNAFSQKNQAPLIVVTCKLAYGLGITKSIDRLSLVVETYERSRAEILLPAVTPPGANNMLRGMDIGPEGIPFVSAFTGTGKESPLYLKHLNGNSNYWFEHDKKHRAIYMQFNMVIHQRDESFPEFYKRMFDYIDNNAESIDKFILDLRFNNGGKGLMVLPFMNEIIKRDNINKLGHLYTLIGRRSFSAAVLLVAEMMLHTQTLLVGEPTGAAQNMFSDIVNAGTLPNCGAALFISSEYFNIAWPAIKTCMIPPHYPAPFSSVDFFSGKDPALEAVLANKAKAVVMVLREDGLEAALNFLRKINYDWGVHANEWGITLFTFPISTKYNSEYEIVVEMLKQLKKRNESDPIQK